MMTKHRSPGGLQEWSRIFVSLLWQVRRATTLNIGTSHILGTDRHVDFKLSGNSHHGCETYDPFSRSL